MRDSIAMTHVASLTPCFQMRRSLFHVIFAASPLLLALLPVCQVGGTVPLVVGTATVLTANQVSALVAIALGIKVLGLKASLLAGATRGGRGRRAAEEVSEVEADAEMFDIEALVELEESDCYKRIFCAAATEK